MVFVQRPIGFSPREISMRRNLHVVSHHAEEAAFLWTLRDRAVREPHYSLEELARLDERVEAHVEGLRIAGDAGWAACDDNVAVGGPGDVFALSALAFAAADRERMTYALRTATALPGASRALVSALGWLDYERIAPWTSRLLEARLSQHRHVGIAALAVHRQDPGVALVAAVHDPDPSLRGRALRAVGELGRGDLANEVRRHLDDEDPACGFWAGWSLARLGTRDGVSRLIEHVQRADAFAERAIRLACRALPLDESRRWIRTLTREARYVRLAVIGAGAAGDPAVIPWLIKRMDDPAVARLAGEAFTLMTGIDLAYHDLDRDAPAVDEDDELALDRVVALDDESSLPWPAAARVVDWWATHRTAFTPGVRYLAGAPVSRESAQTVLLAGKQRQRAAAAVELALLDTERPLFEVRAPAVRQRAQIARWNS